MCDVVVRQRNVEGILFWNKGDRDVIASRARVWAIRSAIIRRPVVIPCAFVVRHRVVSRGILSDPKHRGHDVHFPRVMLHARTGTGRDKNLRFDLKQGLFPQPHRVLGKICRRCIWGGRLFVPEDFRGASNNQTETDHEKSFHAQNRGFFYPITCSQARGIFAMQTIPRRLSIQSCRFSRRRSRGPNKHLGVCFVHSNLGGHPLNPRLLLIQARDESFRCFALLSDCRFEIFSLLRHR